MRKITLKHSLPARLEKHFSEDLNDSQRTAVMAPDGYNLILAGPGSGKTRVITYRVAYLIARGVPADSILLVTFTRRAAREMVHRLESLIGNDAGKVWAGTFHHVGNRLLRRPARLLGYQPNFTILDSEDQLDLIRLAMEDAGFAAKEKLAPKPAEVEHLISFALNTRQSLAEVAAVQSPGLVEWLPRIEIVAAAYTRRKLAANCMDYDDLLTQWLRLVRESPEQLEHQAGMFRHILIDEMQDTNVLQVEIVETIAASGAGNLTAVGDDAQSIYRFRGELRQYSQVPRAASRVAELSARHQLPVHAPDRRLHGSVDPAQPLGVSQGTGLGTRGRPLPRGCRNGRRLRRGRPGLSADPRCQGQRRSARPDGDPLPQPLRQRGAPGRAGHARHSLHGAQRPAVL